MFLIKTVKRWMEPTPPLIENAEKLEDKNTNIVWTELLFAPQRRILLSEAERIAGKDKAPNFLIFSIKKVVKIFEDSYPNTGQGTTYTMQGVNPGQLQDMIVGEMKTHADLFAQSSAAKVASKSGIGR